MPVLNLPVIPSNVLLVEKQRPAWQVGRYNLPGGKIEEDETIHEAAIRELYEETGIMTSESHIMGTIEARTASSTSANAPTTSPTGNDADSMTDEAVLWMPLAARPARSLADRQSAHCHPFLPCELDRMAHQNAKTASA